MPITHITGGKGVGKTFHAQSMRGQAVSLGYGTLFVDDNLKDDGATAHLLEKIIADGPAKVLKGKLGRLTDGLGNPLEETFDPATINWKKSPAIILVNDAIARLADFEAMVPGFTAMFGPVRVLPLGDA